MKKIIFIVSVFFLALSANAQNFKFILGPVFSNYSSQWPVDYPENWDMKSSLNPFDNSRTGVAWGLGVEFAINKKLTMEVNSLYFEKSCLFESYLGFFTPLMKYSLRGVSFPVLIKARFFHRPYSYFITGLDFSFFISHEQIQLIKYLYEATEVGRKDLMWATRKFDPGLVLGIGFEVPISKGSVFLEGRYQYGFTNLNRWSDGQYKARTRTLLIVSGFKI